MNRTDKLVRQNIRELVPYSSARDEFTAIEGIFLDANENPYGTLNRYPDPHHKKLKAAVSKMKELPPENIFFGNGSDEVIDLICRIFCNPGEDKILTFPPTYGMYEVTAAVNNLTVIRVPLDGNFNIDREKTLQLLNDENLKIIFICSPNNPTGNSFEREVILEIIEKSPGIVVIDEAYTDFSIKKSFIQLVRKYDNLIVMQTFSKAWGAAAIRVGMAFADQNIIRYMYRVKPPYNISGLNQREALKRLGDSEKYRKQVVTIKSERIRLEKLISQLETVIKVYPSDANFILVKVKDADYIYKKLIERNIVVRNRSSVVNNCLRITVGTRSENNKLVKDLRSIII